MTRSTYDLSVRTEVGRKSTTKCILQQLLYYKIYNNANSYDISYFVVTFIKVFQTFLDNGRTYLENAWMYS
jgi:hypothetical protein